MASGVLGFRVEEDFFTRFFPSGSCDVCGGRTIFATCAPCMGWAADQIAREIVRSFSVEQVATLLALRILYGGRQRGGL